LHASPGKRKRDGTGEDAPPEGPPGSQAAPLPHGLLAASGQPPVSQQPRVVPPSGLSDCSSIGGGDGSSSGDSRSVSAVAQGATQGAAAGSAAPGGGASAASLAGLPLRGCVSEYVQRWGWSPLPQGTEQMLRDILQTLRSMGLQYTLEEKTDLPAQLMQQEAASAAAAAMAGEPPPDSSTHQLALTIRF